MHLHADILPHRIVTKGAFYHVTVASTTRCYAHLSHIYREPRTNLLDLFITKKSDFTRFLPLYLAPSWLTPQHLE